MSTYHALESDNRVRIDVFLAAKQPNVSRASIQKTIENGHVSINGVVVRQSHKLHQDDTVNVQNKEKSTNSSKSVEIPVLYEDESCLVLEKPLGMLTHSKGAYNPEQTIATHIAGSIEFDEKDRGGIVHRLDRATSGVIITAKTPVALSWLQKQFSSRKVKKVYYALVEGHLTSKEAIIDMPIERNPKQPQMFRVGQRGKVAQTHYFVEKDSSDTSLLRLEPTTGRTHQLRVHPKHIGHAIVGDTFYGGRLADRLFLHAASLELTLPNKQRKTFVSELPSEFYEYLKKRS